MSDFDENIPWPENMPPIVARCAKRLEIYHKNPKILPFYYVEQENMVVYVKTALDCEEISEEDAVKILDKIHMFI